MTLSDLASAIYNDVQGGLVNFHSTPNMSLEQLEDDVIDERLSLIKEWFLRGILVRKDLMLAINCVEVDCKDTAKCCNIDFGRKGMHFEIPQLVNDLGTDAVEFVGSVDREVQYVVYTDTSYQFHKYKRRKSNNPFVYIETTPNENGMYDGWIYNVPFVKYIAVIGIFKDPRQLEQFNCCNDNTYLNFDSLGATIKEKLTKKKLLYYRQYIAPPHPNTQVPG